MLTVRRRPDKSDERLDLFGWSLQEVLVTEHEDSVGRKTACRHVQELVISGPELESETVLDRPGGEVAEPRKEPGACPLEGPFEPLIAKMSDRPPQYAMAYASRRGSAAAVNVPECSIRII